MEWRDARRPLPIPRNGRTRRPGRTTLGTVGVALLALAATWVGLGTAPPASAVTPTAGPRSSAPPPSYQLSLGDSLTAGWGASAPALDYANQLVGRESVLFPGLRLENLACPGETTTTMLRGGGMCSYPQGSQALAAVAFLVAHPDQVRYITIDIGINNIDTCPGASTIDQACVASGIGHLDDDLPLIIGDLHRAAPDVPIVGADSYDPFLAGEPAAGTNDDPYSQLAGLSPGFSPASLVMVDSLNAAIALTYGFEGVRLVDIADAFQSQDAATTGTVAGVPVPQNVADICAWLHMCDSSGLTIHLNDAGESVFADQFGQAVDQAVTTGGDGTWLADAGGGVHPLGDAPFFGDLSSRLDAPIVSLASTGDQRGYWLVAADGGVFSFGDAHFDGSTGVDHLDRPVVGMASTPDGHGYWLVAADGGIFSFGDAHFYGSTGGEHLDRPVVGMAPTPDGHGYWLVAADGGIFSFGDAHFYGSTGGEHLDRPVVGMAPTPGGRGYWLVAADGGVFSFGDAGFFGSTGGLHLVDPVVAMIVDRAGTGYSLAAADGGLFTFGGAPFDGSLGGSPPAAPVVALAGS